ncbi:unnamed protein product [Rotaria sp. Silwood2]|nr:unnamed protein product [Rotaria sp. Silwood2]CAF4475215.1 unnamed protein product [Rotaria sp. Silwood2]
MVSDLYNLDLKNTLPLACGIEYLHISSLILDDFPAQDNSDLRRGQPTLHKTVIDNDIPKNLCEGRAQLAAIDLIAVSMILINHDLVKNGFSPERVNQVVSEISLSMHDLCIGQMMDLCAAHMGIEKGTELLEELDHIAWFKIDKAIEVVIIGSANVEGENIGKSVALDIKNNTVTYVSILGVEGTRQRLKEFRQQTLKLIDECWPSGAETIKDVVSYVVDRKN